MQYSDLDATLKNDLHAALIGHNCSAVVEVMVTVGPSAVAELVDALMDCSNPGTTARQQLVCAAIQTTWGEALTRFQRIQRQARG